MTTPPDVITVVAESREGALLAGPVTGRVIVVGRGRDVTLRVSSGAVARRHCRFEVRDDGVYVEDLQSPGGTFTEDHERIAGTRRLESGARVLLNATIHLGVSWT